MQVEVVKKTVDKLAKEIEKELIKRGGNVVDIYTDIDGKRHIRAVFFENRVFHQKYKDGSEGFWSAVLEITIEHYERGAYKATYRSPLMEKEHFFIGYPQDLLNDARETIRAFINTIAVKMSKPVFRNGKLYLTAESMIVTIDHRGVNALITPIELPLISTNSPLLPYKTLGPVALEELPTTPKLRTIVEGIPSEISLDPIWREYRPFMMVLRGNASKIQKLAKEWDVEAILSIHKTANFQLLVEGVGFIKATPSEITMGWVDLESREYKILHLPMNHKMLEGAIEALLSVAEDAPFPLDETIAMLNTHTLREFRKFHRILSSLYYQVSELEDFNTHQEFTLVYKEKELLFQLFLSDSYPVLVMYEKSDKNEDYQERLVQESTPEDPIMAEDLLTKVLGE